MVVLRTKGAVEAVCDVGGLVAVVVGRDVVVDDAVDGQVRVQRAAEVGVAGIEDHPGAVGGAVSRLGAVGVHAVGINVAPRVLEGVLCEPVGLLLDVRVLGGVTQVPSGILDNNLCRDGVLGGKGRVLRRIRQEVRPHGVVGAEERAQLLQVAEEGLLLVVVGDAAEHVQARLALAEEPVLVEDLPGGSVGVGHLDASVGDAGRVLAREELEGRLNAPGGPEALWRAVAVEVGALAGAAGRGAEEVDAVEGELDDGAAGLGDGGVEAVVGDDEAVGCLCRVEDRGGRGRKGERRAAERRDAHLVRGWLLDLSRAQNNDGVARLELVGALLSRA
ncbi:hypothetical protein CGRA01v4_12766 [Colletotrichum graminicola]|nr:hypothetical protein CGRA01v4_12766 [Colletotrichum graminicola]